MSPWDIAGWLVVILLGIMVLVTACFAIGLLRVAFQTTREDRAQYDSAAQEKVIRFDL